MADSQVKSLYSKTASSGPPLFFPDPEYPTHFNFDQGLAAPETFPKDDLLRLSQEILARDGADALEYFDARTGYEEMTFGYKGLREQVARRILAKQGRDVGPRGVILTSGSVQAIALAASAYVDPGDVVIAEGASFPYALRFMETAGAEIRAVPLDDDGMDVDALERLLASLTAAGKKVKLVYTIPTFQMPTNTEMPLRRREKLLALAARYRFVVLEDNVYGELRFAGEPLPTLLSLDTSGLVIQTGSFSKAVVPGIRLGWMAGPPDAIAALAAVRQDLGTSQWTARVMTEFLARDMLDPHLEKVTAVYRSKCKVAADAVRQHCGNYVRFRQPQGSFYLWLEIDDQVDWPRAADLAARKGIFFRPGQRFMDSTDGRQFLRFAYSHVSEQVISDGIARLGEILRRCARG